MPRTKKTKPTLEGDAENEKAKFEKPILTSYTIKAVIPTASFANIQPEITVWAHTLEQAEEFVLPHVDKLFVKYFNAYQNGIPEVKGVAINKDTVVPPPPNAQPTTMKTDACIKAEQAINGCTSLEALTLVKDRIEKSVKLTPEEKVVLAFTLNTKNDELFKQTNPA
jgi:hypothetical protein